MTVVETAQRSEQWYEARRGLPTCSRFDQILTAAKGEPSKSQETLICALIAESILPPQEGVIRPMSADIEHGIITEAEARCAFELEFAPEPVTEVGFVVHASGLYGGSPDGLVGESGGVEIKCPKAETHIGYFRAGVLPNEYKAQVHGYMAVTGRNWWSFFSYFRGLPPFHIRVTRDDFTAKLEAELPRFCAKYNEARAAFGLPPIGATK
jgi:hypothetical protein